MVIESIEFNPFRVIWIANMNVKAVTQTDLDENSPGRKKYPPFACHKKKNTHPLHLFSFPLCFQTVNYHLHHHRKRVSPGRI